MKGAIEMSNESEQPWNCPCGWVRPAEHNFCADCGRPRPSQEPPTSDDERLAWELANARACLEQGLPVGSEALAKWNGQPGDARKTMLQFLARARELLTPKPGPVRIPSELVGKMPHLELRVRGNCGPEAIMSAAWADCKAARQEGRREAFEFFCGWATMRRDEQSKHNCHHCYGALNSVVAKAVEMRDACGPAKGLLRRCAKCRRELDELDNFCYCAECGCGPAKEAEAPASEGTYEFRSAEFERKYVEKVEEVTKLRDELAQLRAHCASTATLGPDGRYHRAIMTDAEKHEREELLAEIERLTKQAEVASIEQRVLLRTRGELEQERDDLRAKLEQAGDVTALFNVLFEDGETRITHEGVAAEAIRVVRELRAKLAEADGWVENWSHRHGHSEACREPLLRFLEDECGGLHPSEKTMEGTAIRILREQKAELTRLTDSVSSRNDTNERLGKEVMRLTRELEASSTAQAEAALARRLAESRLAESERQRHASDEEARMAKERVERLVERKGDQCECGHASSELKAQAPAQPATVTTGGPVTTELDMLSWSERMPGGEFLCSRNVVKMASARDQAAAVKAATEGDAAERTRLRRRANEAEDKVSGLVLTVEARDRRIAELEADVNRLLPAWHKSCDEAKANAQAARELAEARRLASRTNYFACRVEPESDMTLAELIRLRAILHLDQTAPSAGESKPANLPLVAGVRVVEGNIVEVEFSLRQPIGPPDSLMCDTDEQAAAIAKLLSEARMPAKPAEDGGQTCTGAEFVAAAQSAITPRSDEEVREAIAQVEDKPSTTDVPWCGGHVWGYLCADCRVRETCDSPHNRHPRTWTCPKCQSVQRRQARPTQTCACGYCGSGEGRAE